MDEKTTAVRDIYRYEKGVLTKTADRMVSEYPLTVMVNGQEFVTLVCTPEHLEELVIGFLASEGVIRFEKEIKSFTIDESLGFAYVELTNPGVLEQKRLYEEGHRFMPRERPPFLLSAGCENGQNRRQPYHHNS